MSKKTSGLGRGLGDLLEDNAPEVRSSGTVVRRDAYGEVSISPETVESAEIIHSTSMHSYREAQVYTAVTPISAKNESDDGCEPPQGREEISNVRSHVSSEETIPDSIRLSGETEAVGEVEKNTENDEKDESAAKKGETIAEEPVRRRSLKAIFREFK